MVVRASTTSMAGSVVHNCACWVSCNISSGRVALAAGDLQVDDEEEGLVRETECLDPSEGNGDAVVWAAQGDTKLFDAAEL